MVMVVISIVIAGVALSDILFDKSKNVSARAITQSSPVHSTDDLYLWLESSLDTNFSAEEASQDSSISHWYNYSKINGEKKGATQSIAASKPKYTKGINNIYSLEFDGTDDYLSFDASALNNQDYTVFVVEKRKSSKANNYFLGDFSTSSANESIILGYSADDQVTHSHGGSKKYSASISGYNNSKNPRIFTFTSNSSSGRKTYIDGILAAENNSSEPVSNLSNLDIGKNYDGNIGELIIFNRSIKGKERRSIEDYLAQKWRKTLTRAVASCTSGTITSSGCSANCSIDEDGISLTAVLEGSDTLDCDEPGFDSSDSINYTCSGGLFNVTSGSCSCDSGFTLTSGTCFAACDFSGIDGLIDNSVSTVSGSIACDQPNYNTSDSINFSCSGGTFSQTGGSCSCNSGYEKIGIECLPACSLTGFAGISDRTLSDTSSIVIDCDETGYKTTDSVDFQCSGGTASVNSGSCTCDTGYSMIGGVCVEACDFTGITGLVDGAVAASASNTINCNDTGFDTTDVIEYSCIGGNFTVLNSSSCDCRAFYDPAGTTCTPGCGSATPSYVRLKSGTSSYDIPSDQYYCNAKIWAIGGGGGGGGRGTSSCSGTGGGGGGAGGTVYQSVSLSSGDTLTYSIGGGGSQGNGGSGGDGGDTSLTFNASTITAYGGTGGKFNNNTLVSGGSFLGGDGGLDGGDGKGTPTTDWPAASGGGAIGDVDGGNSRAGPTPHAGGNGGTSADISGLFAALTELEYASTSAGAGGNSGFSNTNGKNATGFGCGGGGAGGGGSYGGNGYFGGGGGGGTCTGTNANTKGGSGGAGSIIIKYW